MNKTKLQIFLLTFFIVIAAIGIVNAQSVTISSNPVISMASTAGNQMYHVSESIYLDSEIGSANFTSASSAINRIAISISTVGAPTSFGGYSIYMKEVSNITTLNSGSLDKAGYTQVYSGTINVTTPGFYYINLTTPFTRTPGNNLQIMFERLDGIAKTIPFYYGTSKGNAISDSALTTRRYNGTTSPVSATIFVSPVAYRAVIGLSHVYLTDAQINGFNLPLSSCYNSPQSIGVTIGNIGSATTIPAGAASVSLSVSGANTSSATTLTNIAAIVPGATETINFSGINLSNPGTNNVKAVVNFAGDSYASNDTLQTSLVTALLIPFSGSSISEDVETNPHPAFPYFKFLQGDAQLWSTQVGKIKNANLSDSLGAHSGNNFFVFDSYNGFEMSKSLLFSNCIDMPAFANGFYKVIFWMSHDTSYSTTNNTYLDSIYVVVSSDKGVTWNRLAGFQRNDPAFPVPGWKMETVDLASYAGQTIQIGFEGVSAYGNIIGLDDIVIIAVDVLPLKLLSFTAERFGSDNQLLWATANEVNTAYFNVQRKVNGNNFANIGKVNATGNGEGKYHFTDELSSLGTGTIYYRLQIIDKDGKSKYSDVRSIKLQTNDRYIILPNPAKDYITVSGRNIADITFTDATGKQVMTTKAPRINISGLARGIYFVRIQSDDDNIQTQKLVVE